MEIQKKKRCRNCRRLFQPNPRNYKKQQYCSEPACRKASKAASQKKWTLKNPDYFRNKENVLRVQLWRIKNPDYSERRLKMSGLPEESGALQDSIIVKSEEKQIVRRDFMSTSLQDLLILQPAVFVGLIAHITGDTLQENLVASATYMLKLGQDIINSSNFDYGGNREH